MRSLKIQKLKKEFLSHIPHLPKVHCPEGKDAPEAKLRDIFFNIYIYLFIYLWLCWVFLAACGLSLVAASGGYSSLRCVGFSLRWLLLFQSTGSRHVGFSSCGTWAQ